MNSSVIPYSDKNTASFMKYEFSSLLAYRSMIDKNRYNLHYTVLVSEPNKYPYNFPRSFAYWRQKIDLLAPHRFSSVLYDKQTKQRKLKYIMDDAYNVFEFVKNIRKIYDDLYIEYICHKEFY